jgi:hypothetical protein
MHRHAIIDSAAAFALLGPTLAATHASHGTTRGRTCVVPGRLVAGRYFLQSGMDLVGLLV